MTTKTGKPLIEVLADSEQAELLEVLRRVVNGATRTMGQNSCGQDYAVILQDVLDLGRETLKAHGIPVNDRMPTRRGR